jgi:monodechloroaminopyrrolnitrin synthase
MEHVEVSDQVRQTPASTSLDSSQRFADVIEQDRAVAGLDPLGADAFLASELPRLNEANDMSALVVRARGFVPEPYSIARMSRVAAMASTRDLAMIASSMQRRQVGLGEVPGLEEALLRLAALTGEIPADSVYSYGPRNPLGERTRRFTNQPGEMVFIDSFRLGMANLPVALDLLVDAHKLSIFDRHYVQCLRTADDFIGQMVDAIVAVHRRITPEFFTGTMRPFFDPKTIGGRMYLAPGGAQMPLIVIDQLLWGVEVCEAEYAKYFFENLEYQPQHVRELAVRLADRPSLVLLACSEARGCSDLGPVALTSLRALERVLATLSKFRRPHKKVADDNLAVRPDDAKGSGGYQADILEYLIEKIRLARLEIASLLPAR